MTSIPTISALLNLSGSQFRFYDIGRKIDKISRQDFEKIENNQMPYPFPLQGHACIAIAFWQKNSPQPYLWFVKLPLDERGLLNCAALNHFIAIIVEALGSDLTVDPSKKQEALLKNNPYLFTPSQYKLAALNSIINFGLKQPASQHYQQCLAYISGQSAWSDWHNVGVQGLTDFAVRLSYENNTDLLIKAIPHLPEEVLSPLCAALENEQLPVGLIDVIINKIKYSQNNITLKAQLLRCIASNCHHPHNEQLVDELIEKRQLSTDDFITLAGRCWLMFQNQFRLMQFLELMVESQETHIFTAIFKDLVAIPVIRPNMFLCMRDTSRSDKLSQAIGLLFSQAVENSLNKPH